MKPLLLGYHFEPCFEDGFKKTRAKICITFFLFCYWVVESITQKCEQARIEGPKTIKDDVFKDFIFHYNILVLGLIMP